MRISTSGLYDASTTRLSDLQASLVKSQAQISSGRRLVTAADDPVASARAMAVTQSQNINAQFASNRTALKATLSQEENVLQGVTDLLQDIKTLAVAGGNGAYEPVQLKFLAAELEGKYNDLLGMANGRDGLGNYVFSGYQTNTQAFSNSATGIQFNGDPGERMMQVGSTRQMSMSDSGAAVFVEIQTGNGKFVTEATPPVPPAVANTGTGIISPGVVFGAISADTFNIVFSDGGKTYSVFNANDPGTVLSTGAYVDGQTISLDGGARQVDIKGVPADGDSFTVKPSVNQSMFATIQNMITTLKNANSTDLGRTALAQGLSTANLNIDNALDNILTIRASVGARLNEIDRLDSDGDSRNLLFAESLRDLQDLDYVKAISDLGQQTMVLEAAQKSFVKVTGLSLFNFL